jgi:HB1, ASXL, restriction endonuclease HTH domain
MTAKKKTTSQALPDNPKKARKPRVPDSGDNTTEAAQAAGKDAATAAPPPAGTDRAAKPTKTPKAKARSSATPARKLSALDAAAKVLGETGRAMTCPELIAAMAAKGYWTSPAGKTPASTLYAACLREIQTKGEGARFRKTERGKFALRGTV